MPGWGRDRLVGEGTKCFTDLSFPLDERLVQTEGRTDLDVHVHVFPEALGRMNFPAEGGQKDQTNALCIMSLLAWACRLCRNPDVQARGVRR